MTTPQLPFTLLGGEPVVRQLVELFYDAMDAHEPALAAMHERDEHGRVSRRSRDRFALFLVGWLGGPQEYMRLHGHPRLRMRHGALLIGIAERDAWLRCMQIALNACNVKGELRNFLNNRFAEVANFLRNVPEAAGAPPSPTLKLIE